MSVRPKISQNRLSPPQILARKGGDPLVALTAYTAPIARLLDPQVDILLVGDSLGPVLYGFANTLPVTIDMMILHGRAVVHASQKACVVVDMPFGTYQASPAQAFENCARVMQETGCSAVKLEGGAEMAETIAFLSARGIPVMAHVGLMPQQVQQMGGYKVQGKTPAAQKKLIADAKAVAGAGAFTMVLEGVPPQSANAVTKAASIPVIGIGASAECDGQVLVIDDMLGMFEATPKFVKKYADMAGVIEKAVRDYARDVRARKFPGQAQYYKG